MSDNETVKERFIRGLGKNYISKEKHKKMQDDIWTGRKIVISYDDSYVPYYPSVTLEESKANGKNLITDKDREEMRRKLVSGEMVIISDDDLSRPYYPLVPLEKV